MQDKYLIFKNKIFDYCEIHKGKEVLFPLFVNLYPKLELNKNPKPKDLAVLTSKIISELIKEKRLKEIQNKKSESVYGLYKIL